MSETTDATEATEPTAAQGATPNDAAELGEGGKKALESERTARKAAEKAASDLKARLDELEAANLSDLEKAQKAATDAQQRLAEIEATALRQKVAIEKGVPAKWVDRLRGTTEEELAADADLILADVPASPTTPKPDLSQGQGTPSTATTADQFATAIESAFTR
jgi:hypothetical protein